MEKEIKKQEMEPEKEKFEERVIRIMSTDIEGKMSVYSALTKIRGVSWGLANALCNVLKIEKRRKIGSLPKEDIKKIEDFMKDLKIPAYLLNRRKDFNEGKDKHLTGSSLELQKEFDIKRLKKIKSYRGLRHATGQPVRGQRTRSHFRKNRKSSTGIKKKTKKPEK